MEVVADNPQPTREQIEARVAEMEQTLTEHQTLLAEAQEAGWLPKAERLAFLAQQMPTLSQELAYLRGVLTPTPKAAANRATRRAKAK